MRCFATWPGADLGGEVVIRNSCGATIGNLTH
jgi:hypothetical protein